MPGNRSDIIDWSDQGRIAPDHVRAGKVKFATNAFFFQEGTAKLYERARFGEFRVAPNGDLLLTHMIGANFERLGPSPR